jgi:hypothetical protein
VPDGIGMGELGAQEKNLRRVVDPDQDEYKRTGRSIASGDVAAADVKADQ